MTWLFLGGILAAGLVVLTVLIAMAFRIVVSTNDVHIVQSRGATVSYGKGQEAGNTYYRWPSWVPVIGIKTIQLPVSVFDQTLSAYAAYDKGRVPFVVDVMAFFRITDSNMAAQRIGSFDELLEQLKSILQGSVRTILASSEIEQILEGRRQFGQMFTEEVDHQLVEWGVQNVKTIELMDIRDAEGSKVIANIMAKNKSKIEMESRQAVAANIQKAEVAEIEAKRTVEVQRQDAEQQVGLRTATKEQMVGIAHEQAQQEIKAQAKITAERNMAVLQVQQVRAADIAKEVQVVQAEQDKATTIIKAEGVQTQTVLIATGNLDATKLASEGIRIEGEAEGAAETAVLLAPVTAQITLAKEIGTNPGYQTYLVSIKQIEAGQVVGIEQAKALTAAQIKVIANSGSPGEGVKGVMDLFTPKGGLQLGAMLEAFKATDAGEEVLKTATNGKSRTNLGT